MSLTTFPKQIHARPYSADSAGTDATVLQIPIAANFTKRPGGRYGYIQFPVPQTAHLAGKTRQPTFPDCYIRHQMAVFRPTCRKSAILGTEVGPLLAPVGDRVQHLLEARIVPYVR